MEVRVWFGFDNTAFATAHDSNGALLFELEGQTEKLVETLREGEKTAATLSEAYRVALARILYSLFSWD